MKCSTSRFSVKEVIYDDGSFAIAAGNWKTDKGLWQYSIACRWYSNGIGYPQSYGKPQWLVLPIEIEKLISSALLLGIKKKLDTNKPSEYLKGNSYQLSLNI